MKTVRIFSDRIWDRIHLEGFRSVRIWVWIFNIRYCIRIQILKSHIYDVDIQLYPIRHGSQYLYSNPNLTRITKTNVISVISDRIQFVFIPCGSTWVCSWASEPKYLIYFRLPTSDKYNLDKITSKWVWRSLERVQTRLGSLGNSI